MKKIAIVGAGLTGLSIAFYLKKAGIPFVVFEKDSQTGGVIKSEKKEGFIIEKGPNTGVVASLELANLLEEISDISHPIYASEASKKRLIWKNGKWNALPSGIISALSTPLFSTRDKIKVAGEYFRKKGNFETESLAGTVKRRLGKSFLDYAIDPFVSGVYAGDPETLITKYAFPKLYNLEEKYGGFIKGSIKIAKERTLEYKEKVNKKIFSFENGLQSLTYALTTKIGLENIRLNQNSLAIEYLFPYQFKINNEDFTHIISTISARGIEKLLPFVPGDELTNIKKLTYAPVIEISLGFKEWKGMNLDAFGGLIPTKENKNLLGVLFMSSQFPNRAPKNGVFFSVFMGGVKKPEFLALSDNEIITILNNDFKEIMQLEKFFPDLIQIHRHPNAIAQYGLDTKARLNEIDQLEKKYPGLLLKGNIKDGIGIADRVTQAVQTAQKLIKE